jgi:hypothetical protein
MIGKEENMFIVNYNVELNDGKEAKIFTES